MYNNRTGCSYNCNKPKPKPKPKPNLCNLLSGKVNSFTGELYQDITINNNVCYLLLPINNTEYIKINITNNDVNQNKIFFKCDGNDYIIDKDDCVIFAGTGDKVYIKLMTHKVNDTNYIKIYSTQITLPSTLKYNIKFKFTRV